MDPNAALEACRRKAARIIADAEQEAASHESRNSDTLPSELAETFLALDQWLSKGGFLPEDWKAGRS